MKKYFPSFIRVPLIFFSIAGILEYMIDSGEIPAFLKYKEVFIILLLVLFILIAFEACYAAIENLLWKITPKEELKALAEKPSWFDKLIKNISESKSAESEEEIVLNHNYDGIKELDNALPTWWVYLFYATIVFAVVYLFRFEVFGGYTQVDELNEEIKVAELKFEEWKKTAPDYVDVSSVTLLTDASDLEKGKQVFIQNCAVCHKPDGGGSIGPNLTDEHWILGGGVKNIFKTISKGGRPNKGMEAWGKKGLKAVEIQQISSYIVSLEGSNPPGAKKAEGEIWKGE